MAAGSIRDYFDAQGTREDTASLVATCGACGAAALMAGALSIAIWLGVVHSFGRHDEALVGATAASTAVSLMASLWMFAEIRRRLGREGQPLIPRFVLVLLCVGLLVSSVMLLVALRAPGPGRFQALILAAAQLPGLLLFTPPLLAVALRLAYHFRTLTQVLQFDEVAEDRLPPRVAAFFASVTPEIDGGGFQRIGDFRQKSDDRQFTRVWRATDGQTFAEATVARMLCCQMSCTSCVSFLADGTLVECGTTDLPGSGIDDYRLCMRSAPSADFAELLALHRATLDSLREAHGDPLPLTIDDYQIVTHYGILQTHRRLIREGVLGSTPYEPLAAQLEASIEQLIGDASPVAH